MYFETFIRDMKQKALKGLVRLSGNGELATKSWSFPKGKAEISVVRGGPIEKAAITHMTLRGTIPGKTAGEFEHVVYQIEVFPENPYCPMGHLNSEWAPKNPELYSINHMKLDLFPAIRYEEDLRAMKMTMDSVAYRFELDTDKIRVGLDTQYTMDHFEIPLASKVGCRLLELKETDYDLAVAAYEAFLDTYFEILDTRKSIAYTKNDAQIKLERNGRWLEYLTLKDGAIKAARDTEIPPELIVEFGFPPSAIF